MNEVIPSGVPGPFLRSGPALRQRGTVMFTTEKLRRYGADVDAGLSRCMNNEAFYLQVAEMILREASFERFEEAAASGDLKAAFEAAHALKGVAGNLSLTPLYEIVSEVTELLRAGTEMDYSEYIAKIRAQKEILRKLSEED